MDSGRPAYDEYADMRGRNELGEAFARQALLTAGPHLGRPASDLDVLDLGSGYGHTAAALARQCRSVVGLEPMSDLHAESLELEQPGLTFRLGGVEALGEVDAYDLIVLDNVYEHLPDHALALANISRALRPGGVLYMVMPNRAWPIEAHYRLPLLSWLPLPLANAYLRASGRGTDYTDASYAPTLWGLRKQLRRRPELDWSLVLPADPTATMAGTPAHYRAGMALLRRVPALWAISKAFLVVAVKRG